MAKRVVLFLAEGFEEVEAVTPIDLLRRAGIEVIVAGIGNLEIKGSHDIIVRADCLIDKLVGKVDGVVIPGGMPGAANIAACEPAMALIRQCREDGRLVAAICAAPVVVLHNAGLVDGLRITAYPAMQAQVSRCTCVNERVVVDQNVITSQGVGSAAEFACQILATLLDRAAADKIHQVTVQKD